MAIMGTFSSFTTARLAIYASQASLNVTGNNIANINTAGYTRQRMDLVSLYSNGVGKYKSIYNTNVGYGVMANGVTQLRDPYLDIRYRNENAKLGANSEKLDGLTQMSRILDEVGKGTGQKEGFGVIEAQFGSLFQSLENLADNVGSPEYDDLVRTEADILATYFNKAAQDLKDIQDIKSKQIYEYMADINKLLTNIRDLNDQIRTQGIYGDNALELRDARNTSLDKLSEYLHINVEYSMERIDQFTEVEKLTVTLAGSKGYDGNPIKLVDGIFGGQISIPENVPVVNPDYDPVAINRAKEDTRKKTEDAYPLSDWEAGFDAVLKRELDAIDAANAADQERWASRFEAAEKGVLGNTPLENATDAQKKAVEAAKEAVDKERKETIAALRAVRTQELESAWQAGIDAQMVKERKAIEAANAPDAEEWAKKTKTAVEQAVNALGEGATLIEKREAEEKAKAAVELERLAEIDAKVAEKKDELWSIWKAGLEEQMKKESDSITAANALDKEPWATELDEAIAKELSKLPDPGKPTEEEREAAQKAAEAAVEKKQRAAIEAAVAEKEKELRRAAGIQRQGIIDDAVQKTEDEQVAAGGKYVADPNANPPVGAPYTNDPTKAMTYANDKFYMQIEPLKDRRDRLMIDPNTVSKESETAELDDVVLYGKIQAIREMLTEEGEYASQDDIDMDPDAALKRGIPYYQKALDNLARKVAEIFNQENQLPAEKVYLSAGAVYIDKDGQLTDAANLTDKANPKTTVTPFLKNTGDGATKGGVTDENGKAVTTDRLKANQDKIDEVNAKGDKATPDEVAAAEEARKDIDLCLKALEQKCVTDENGELVTTDRLDDARAVIIDSKATAEKKAEAEADMALCLEALRRSGVKDPLYEFYDGGVLFSNNGNNNDPSGITAANITVSAAWANGSVRVLNDKRPDSYASDGTVIKHSSRNDNIQHLASMYNEQLDYYATDVQPDAAAALPVLSGSFREVFTAISGTLADDSQATTGKVDSYTITTLNLDNDRLSVSGVDLNEEATSMMQFSKSYSAACRLLTTLDEMLDKLINGTAL